MLKDKKVIEYAVKGVDSEIEKLEKTINQGKQFLSQYENGEKPKTPKTPQEIQNIINQKKAEIENLSQFKNELIWELSEF